MEKTSIDVISIMNCTLTFEPARSTIFPFANKSSTSCSELRSKNYKSKASRTFGFMIKHNMVVYHIPISCKETIEFV
jgi:hypothetical protein